MLQRSVMGPAYKSWLFSFLVVGSSPWRCQPSILSSLIWLGPISQLKKEKESRERAPASVQVCEEVPCFGLILGDKGGGVPGLEACREGRPGFLRWLTPISTFALLIFASNCLSDSNNFTLVGGLDGQPFGQKDYLQLYFWTPSCRC